MFSYIKRHWPIYLILTLIAIALGFGAAYVVGVKGSTPETTMNEEVSKSKVWVPTVFPSPIRQPSMAVRHLLNSRFIVYAQGGRAGRLARPPFYRASASL